LANCGICDTTVAPIQATIEVTGQVFMKVINNKQQQCLNVQVSLSDGFIDDQHDLLYLVGPHTEMPLTYKDLSGEFVVRLKAAGNVGQGLIAIS
jgi:hypothetical protein